MPTPATPTLTLADKLVDVIQAAWGPAAPDAVSREYDPPITEETVSKLTGRKVYLLPKSYQIGPDTRGKNEYRHSINVLTVERYAGDGMPPASWTDARVDFVYAQVVQRLDYAKGGQLLFAGRAVRTVEIGEVEVCLVDYLTGHTLFWCEVEFHFAEALS